MLTTLFFMTTFSIMGLDLGDDAEPFLHDRLVIESGNLSTQPSVSLSDRSLRYEGALSKMGDSLRSLSDAEFAEILIRFEEAQIVERVGYPKKWSRQFIQKRLYASELYYSRYLLGLDDAALNRFLEKAFKREEKRRGKDFAE